MQVVLAKPRGFCAGVVRAIAIVEKAIEKYGVPIYVRHEVVHNHFVCDNLRRQGAIFVDDLSEVPEGSTVIFSAHGVSLAIREEAARRHLVVLDATCPLVTRVHLMVERMQNEGREVIMIGHKGHPEVEGTMGQSAGGMYLVENEADVNELEVNASSSLAYVTQTTLSMDDAEKVAIALKAKFPQIAGPKRDEVCYATQNRQDAVKKLARESELVLVVGSRASSNSNRLREVAENLGVPAYLIDDATQIDPAWLEGVKVVGVTAGASAPEVLVQSVVDYLVEGHPDRVRQLDGIEENITFALPRELRE